jgi:repressor LexA
LHSSGINTRIKHVRKTLKASQKEFAAATGISQGYLCSLERREKTPSETVIKAICHEHGVNETWLATGKGEPFKLTRHKSGIPVFHELPGNFPEYSESREVTGWMSISDMPENGFALLQTGDFMAPTLKNGDLVICEPIREMNHDDIVLIKNLWGTWIFRRFRRNGDKEMFTPDNTIYRPFAYNPGEQHIVAKVVRILRDVHF